MYAFDEVRIYYFFNGRHTVSDNELKMMKLGGEIDMVQWSICSYNEILPSFGLDAVCQNDTRLLKLVLERSCKY